MTIAEIDGIIRLYTTDEDVARPGLSRPWRTPSGCVVATDGKIAIACRNVPPELFRCDTDEADLIRSRDIIKWIQEDKEDANLGFRVPIPLDFVDLGRAAAVALSDAMSYFRPESWYELDEECVDGDPDTPDDFAQRHSVVVLPDARRTKIAARYAATVAQTVAAFGGSCTAYGWPPGKMPLGRRNDGYERLLFVGEGYDVLLMPLREKTRFGGWIKCAQSVADAATGRLVQSYGEGAK